VQTSEKNKIIHTICVFILLLYLCRRKIMDRRFLKSNEENQFCQIIRVIFDSFVLFFYSYVLEVPLFDSLWYELRQKWIEKRQTNTDMKKKKQNMHGIHRHQAKRKERMRTEAAYEHVKACQQHARNTVHKVFFRINVIQYVLVYQSWRLFDVI